MTNVRVSSVHATFNYAARGNDAVLALGAQACAAVAAAQAAGDDAARLQLFDRAVDLREREFQAWFVLGDKVGQALAASGVANALFLSVQLIVSNTLIASQSAKIQQARTWYARALELLLDEHGEEAHYVRQIAIGNNIQLGLYAGTRLAHKQVRIRGLINQPLYNWRVGKVLGPVDLETPKHKVRLEATPLSPAVTIIVRECNLELV